MRTGRRPWCVRSSMSLSAMPRVKKNVPEEALAAVAETRNASKLADLASGHLGVEVEQKQELLETLCVAERLGEGLRPDAGRNVRAEG